ncbi:MAG: hypothetical protein JNK12_17510 [Acidimicrobiales bacterium]|nr:hypothetical protein [Acidimicrobiales bacterium]
MNQPEPTPDDLLVSAVLDGVASPDDVARVTGDPGLTARLEQFRSVARAVGGPVPLVDPVVRDAHLARAVAALGSDGRATTAPAAAAAPPEPRVVPTPPPPPSELSAARARRQRRLGPVILSVAAALVLVAAAGALVLRLGDTTGSSSSDEAATATAPDAPAESGDDGGDASAGAADSEQFTPGVPSTTAPDGAGTAATEAGIDPALPTLGTFAKGEDLAARVRGELVLDPSPTQRATDEACLDDFGVEVVLLGRATVDGEEGLVYVESDPSASRRLWFVDPATIAADGTCREVVPVQRL